MALTFSNPRLRAEIPDYPLGGNKRGLCVFAVEEHPTRGFRFTRQTFGKPKTSTYGGKAAIVDGSDGRTYLIQQSPRFGSLSVSASDFKNPSQEVLGFYHYLTDADSQYAGLLALITQANTKG